MVDKTGKLEDKIKERPRAEYIRIPDRFEDTDKNIDILHARIHFLTKSAKVIKQSKILNDTEISTSATQFSRWVNSKTGSGDRNIIRGHNYSKLVDYLSENNFWDSRDFGQSVDNIPDFMFYSMNRFLGINESNTNSVRKMAPGTYILYTNSLIRPNHIIVGALWITFDPDTHGVRTYEIQKYSGDKWSRSKKEIYKGFIIRKARKFTIISRNESTDSLQVYFLPHYFTQDDKITSFEGLMVGMYGGHAFSRPVVLERWEETDQALEEKLDLYPEEEISPMIMAVLKNERSYQNLNLF